MKEKDNMEIKCNVGDVSGDDVFLLALEKAMIASLFERGELTFAQYEYAAELLGKKRR